MKIVPIGMEMHLEPETERDQRILQHLLKHGFLTGYGKHPETDEFLHAQVTLEMPYEIRQA